jgi:general stress protein 26
MTDERKTVYDLLSGYDNVMLVTHGTDGGLDARPMHVAKLEEDCDLWFFTSDDGKVDQLRAEPGAMVVAQDEESSWLSVWGRVEIVRDRAKVDELWQEPYRTYFPDGKDDPTLRLLAFRAERGEYWDQRGTNKVRYAIKALKAYVSGTTPEPDEGIHGKATL